MRRRVRVRLSAPESFLPHARKLGLETYSCRPKIDSRLARRFAGSWDHWGKCEAGRLNWGRPAALDLPGRFDDLMTAVRDADLFIYTSTQFLGNLIPEKTGIPSMVLAISPTHVALRPENPKGQKPSVSEEYQPLLHPVDGEPLVHILDHIRQFREKIGLPGEPADSSAVLSIPAGSDVIAAISRHLCDPDRARFPNLDFTGFWFHERPEWNNWRPAPSLERFVEKGAPPLVLTFSSLPLSDPESVLRIHARTAMLLDRKLVILSGWAGFQKSNIPLECREHMYISGDLPHRWLFDRSAAVIHHGGIGTLAQAVRCGKPMLIEPYGNDQFFNASRAIKLGIGAAANPRWMIPEALAELIENKVMNPETVKRVRNLADAMSTDPGVEYVADLVMSRL